MFLTQIIYNFFIEIYDDFENAFLQQKVLDLTIALVFGKVFVDMILSLVSNIITPIISGFMGQISYEDLDYTFNGSQIEFGKFLNTFIYFVLTIITLYIIFIKPFNDRIEEKKKIKEKTDIITKPYISTI